MILFLLFDQGFRKAKIGRIYLAWVINARLASLVKNLVHYFMLLSRRVSGSSEIASDRSSFYLTLIITVAA